MVDDDPVTLDQLYALVRFHMPNVAVEAIGSSVVALERLKTNQYDLLVTDLAMSEREGAVLATHLYNCNPTVPLILISGGPLHGAPPVNMFAYLSKPIDRDRFIHIVGSAIQHRRSLHPSTCDCGEKLMAAMMRTEDAEQFVHPFRH
jgi:DNA-binding NtrC family response regulator